MTPFYRFASRGVIIPFLRAISRQEVEGLENLPQQGGFIAVANHLSDLDSLTTMRALVDADVPAYSLAKASLFNIPVLGKVFKAGGQIPVYRGSDQASNALVEAERRIRQGDVVMIFPEGTLSRDPLRWPMTGKTGAARLAMATGAPVVPMGQWGAHEIMDTMAGGSFKPFPRKTIRVKIGEPFTLEEYGSDTSDRQAVKDATARIMREITTLVEDLRGEKAPRPYDLAYDGDPGKNPNGRDYFGTRRPDPEPVPEERADRADEQRAGDATETEPRTEQSEGKTDSDETR